ncbi:MAG: hypothetical protein HYX68_10360 [Planctomycetes bacterium]|nr:hypothetical protein [Planctomycetota bacterium]
MSSKNANDGSLQTTKQMLDDLDALMEKMLALPVNDLEDAPPFPKEVVRAPTLSAKLTLLQSPPEPPSAPPDPPAPTATTTVEPFVGFAPFPHPAFQSPHFNLPVEPEAPRQAPAPLPAPVTNDIAPAAFRPRLEPTPIETPTAEPTPGPRIALHPLVWINQAFDHATTFLGGSGAWLRGPAGRALLGLSGIALSLIAVGWFLKDWMGWNWPWAFIG